MMNNWQLYYFYSYSTIGVASLLIIGYLVTFILTRKDAESNLPFVK